MSPVFFLWSYLNEVLSYDTKSSAVYLYVNVLLIRIFFSINFSRMCVNGIGNLMWKNDDMTILAENNDDIKIFGEKIWRYYDISWKFWRYYDIGYPPCASLRYLLYVLNCCIFMLWFTNSKTLIIFKTALMLWHIISKAHGGNIYINIYGSGIKAMPSLERHISQYIRNNYKFLQLATNLLKKNYLVKIFLQSGIYMYNE